MNSIVYDIWSIVGMTFAIHLPRLTEEEYNLDFDQRSNDFT